MINEKPIEYHINENGCHICTSHCIDKGYPVIKRNGKKQNLHRYIYEKTYGNVPQDMVIRHICDCTKCINIDHLEIGRHRDNDRDRVVRGRSAKGERIVSSKLTEEQVKEIYLAEGLSQRQLAAKYEVSHFIIGKIRRGENWKHVTAHLGTPRFNPLKSRVMGKLSRTQVREIYINTKPYKQLAAEFDVSEKTISNIKSGDSYAIFTADLRERDKNTYFSKANK